MLEIFHSAMQEGRDDGGSTEGLPDRVRTTSGAPATDATADPSTDGDAEPVPVHLDQVFGILKNRRRRSVLEYMQSADGEVRLGELSEQIAAWECDKPVKQITSDERKRVYVGLYQSHLPKMDESHAIDYNKQRGKISPGRNMATFTHYLPDDEAASTDRLVSDYPGTILLAAMCLLLALTVAVVLW